MSKFVIHPVWPVKSLKHMEYGLFQLTCLGEREITRSHSLDQMERLLRRLHQHRHD